MAPGGGLKRATELHPLVLAAGRDDALPPWACCTPGRQEHSQRVAALMSEWATALGRSEPDQLRWRAAAILHDALRDAEPSELVPIVDLKWPPGLLHGPACAERLRGEGVDDDDILDAIAFHTVGHPRLTELGRHLYMADFLEPGRRFLREERAALRARVPRETEAVVRRVAALRIGQRLDRHDRIPAESVEFWNRLVEEA